MRVPTRTRARAFYFMEAKTIELINPKNGDKYSANLYKYLKKYKRSKHDVYRNSEDSSLWIGYFDEHTFFIGAKMASVLCEGGKAFRACFPPSFFTLPVLISDFWENYQKIGRCAIDSKHERCFIGGERWSKNGNVRTCLWCGHVQYLKQWTETVERNAWENEPTTD